MLWDTLRFWGMEYRLIKKGYHSFRWYPLSYSYSQKMWYMFVSQGGEVHEI